MFIRVYQSIDPCVCSACVFVCIWYQIRVLVTLISVSNFLWAWHLVAENTQQGGTGAKALRLGKYRSIISLSKLT